MEHTDVKEQLNRKEGERDGTSRLKFPERGNREIISMSCPGPISLNYRCSNRDFGSEFGAYMESVRCGGQQGSNGQFRLFSLARALIKGLQSEEVVASFTVSWVGT